MDEFIGIQSIIKTGIKKEDDIFTKIYRIWAFLIIVGGIGILVLGLFLEAQRYFPNQTCCASAFKQPKVLFNGGNEKCLPAHLEFNAINTNLHKSDCPGNCNSSPKNSTKMAEMEIYNP